MILHESGMTLNPRPISWSLPFNMRRKLILLLAVLLLPCVALADEFGPGYNEIQEEGTAVTKRRRFNFIGSGVTAADDSANGRTNITISAGSGITIGTTAITSGTDTRVLFDDAGTVGEDAGFVYVKGTDTATLGNLALTNPLPVASGGTNASSASITAFNNITGYTASGATGTTSTNIVFSTSPSLTTPTIGAATATSIAIGANTLTTTEWAFLDGQDQAVLTTSDVTHRIITSAHTIPSYVWTDSDGDDYEGVLDDSVLRITNTSDGITGYIHRKDNSVGLGEEGKAPAYLQFQTDGGSGDAETRFQPKSIGQAEIDFPNIPLTRSIYVENLTSADDDISMGSWDRAVTIKAIWVTYNGTGTTEGAIALQDGAGNAMTHTVPDPVTQANIPTRIPVTANGSLTARELLAFDTTNTPSPSTDDYTLTIEYTYDS